MSTQQGATPRLRVKNFVLRPHYNADTNPVNAIQFNPKQSNPIHQLNSIQYSVQRVQLLDKPFRCNF